MIFDEKLSEQRSLHVSKWAAQRNFSSKSTQNWRLMIGADLLRAGTILKIALTSIHTW